MQLACLCDAAGVTETPIKFSLSANACTFFRNCIPIIFQVPCYAPQMTYQYWCPEPLYLCCLCLFLQGLYFFCKEMHFKLCVVKHGSFI